MPEIKLQSVVTFNAEDPKCPAENLLKTHGAYKWKGPSNSAKNEVILQFEKASQIHSIDIGNEGSAFVEVLVGRSAAPDKSFEVLLVASSFMTPIESRNGTNLHSVRMFGTDKLTKSVSSEKWDRVKIVCTQPFNKASSYGLSFIRFHSPPDASEKGSGESGSKKIGAFFLKPEQEDDVKTGSMFAKKNQEAPTTGAAAVRAASRLAEESKRELMSSLASKKDDYTNGKPEPKSDTKPEPKPSTSKTESSTTSVPHGGSKRKHAMSDEENTDDENPASKPPLKKQTTSLSSTASFTPSEKLKMKRTKSEPAKDCTEKSFHKLMQGVVFSLSGFQNPFRGDLRDKAMEMGAVYKPDWKKGCTHLICAFPNTPKYNQVNGKGKIVKKEWVMHCHKQKTLLPWRKYRLGDADSPHVTSDEESEEEYTPRKKKSPPKTNIKTEKIIEKKKPVASKKKYGDSDSGDDTEEELERVKAKLASSETKDDNPYDDSTDEDVPSTSKKSSPAKNSGKDVEINDSDLPQLPDYFSNKHFYLYGDFPQAERRLMVRYITAYDGELEDYMTEKVDYVVTNSEWDENFDEALSEHPKLVFVKPKWLHVCHDKEKLVPYQHHIVIPKD